MNRKIKLPLLKIVEELQAHKLYEEVKHKAKAMLVEKRKHNEELNNANSLQEMFEVIHYEYSEQFLDNKILIDTFFMQELYCYPHELMINNDALLVHIKAPMGSNEGKTLITLTLITKDDL